MADPARLEEIPTTVGVARAHVFPVPRGVPRATLVLGHGAGAGGVRALDLQLLADRLPGFGIDVVLVEQPWLVAGRKSMDTQPKVDAAFREVVTDLKRSGEALRRLVVGGRSTGGRIACRTAADLGADAVLCLAFPLRPPSKPERSRADELVAVAETVPVTVIQGERDRFGSPVMVAAAAAERDVRVVVIAVPWADHSFKVPMKANVTSEEVALILVESARRTLVSRVGNTGLFLER